MLKDLMERRSKIINAMRQLTASPAGNGGDLSEEQAAKFDEMRADLTKVEKDIERAQVMADAERRMQGQPVAGSGDDRFDVEVRNFSMLRAMAGAAGMSVDCGREREISTELARRSGLKPQGILVPMQVFEKRVTTSTGTGGNLVATDHMGGQFIDILRANLITGRLGATVLSGLSGNVEIPKRTGSVTAGWVAENSALSLSDATFDQVTMAPKHVGALTELSRNMLQQSSPDIEQLTRNDMAAVLAQAIDTAAIQGSGVGANPTGILNVSGIGTATLSSTPTWAEALACLGDLEDVNNDGTGWAMHPKARRKFKGTLKVSGDAGAGYLMGDDNRLAGYGTAATTTLPTNLGAGTNETPVIFGRWSDLMIGYWSAFDLLVNPYESTAYSKGNVQIRAMLTADVAVRHAESFTAGNLVVA